MGSIITLGWDGKFATGNSYVGRDQTDKHLNKSPLVL